MRNESNAVLVIVKLIIFRLKKSWAKKSGQQIPIKLLFHSSIVDLDFGENFTVK